jgi:translocator protein
MIPSWLVIGIVTFLVALCGNIFRPKDIRWFKQLERPRWLIFEKLIPLVWIVVFICGAWSAYIIWEQNLDRDYTWQLMIFYLLVEITIVAYQPTILWSHSLIAGTLIGGVGFLLGVVLTLMVAPISGWAAWLLIPYLLWSPIGTYATLAIACLNPEISH